MDACSKTSLEVVEALISSGANLDVRDQVRILAPTNVNSDHVRKRGCCKLAENTFLEMLTAISFDTN